MTTVNSIAELEREINKHTKYAMFKARNKIYEIINQKLHEYYNEYSPSDYERTLSILRSLVKTSSKDGMEFEVYFDTGGTKYKTGDWSTPEVYKNVLTTGLHTADVSGTNVWKESKEEIGNVIELIKKELIAQGITVE